VTIGIEQSQQFLSAAWLGQVILSSRQVACCDITMPVGWSYAFTDLCVL
jgi:hypothetical protein